MVGDVRYCFVYCGGIFFIGNYPLLTHQRQHGISSFSAFGDVFVGSVTVWRFDHPCKQGTFRNGQVACLFVKVDVCGVFDTVGIASEVNGVKVHFQNFLFAVAFFQLQRQQHFIYFASEIFAVVKVRILYQLLSNGGGAFFQSAAFYIVKHCAANTFQVDTTVGKESFVLHGNKSHVSVFVQRRQRYLLVFSEIHRVGKFIAAVVDNFQRKTGVVQFAFVVTHVAVAFLQRSEKHQQRKGTNQNRYAKGNGNYLYYFFSHSIYILCCLYFYIYFS